MAVLTMLVLSVVLHWSCEPAVSKSAIQAGEKAAVLSFGDPIQRSSLIAVGQYKKAGTVLVREVLKGDKSVSGKSLELSAPMLMGCRRQAVPDLDTAVVLLSMTGGKPSIIEIFDTPEDISAVRCLTRVYGMPSEKERLKQLGELFIEPPHSPSGKPVCDFTREYLWAIDQMREPANFELVKQLYNSPSLTAKNKLSLQQWIGNSADPRAIPVLLAALKSPDKFVASDAVTKLIYYYPGSETDTALKTMLKTCADDVRPGIVRYLSKRGLKPTNAAESHFPQTVFQKASELTQNGNLKDALPLYMSILESSEEDGYIVRNSALKALEHGDSSVAHRIAKARMQWLNNDAVTANYLEAQDTAVILRKLKNIDAIPGLLAILQRRDFIFDTSNRIATMALLELGPTARRKAVATLLQGAADSPSIKTNHDEQLRLLLELAWLKQPSDQDAIAKQLGDNPAWVSSLRALQPVLNVLPATDEARNLVQLLSNEKEAATLPILARDWIVYRLGDLRETRAADLLLDLFEKSIGYNSQVLTAAITSIGGQHVVSRLEAIAQSNTSNCRAQAIETLVAISKEKSVPFLRRLLKATDLDVKVRVLNGLGLYGNCQDYALLKPSLDFWSGERKLHYWTLQAISQIEDRCHCSTTHPSK